jgi:exopolysaccharide production protein ExoZ
VLDRSEWHCDRRRHDLQLNYGAIRDHRAVPALSETRRGTIANVQALRGGAALLVALGHGARTGAAPEPILSFVSWSSYAGVDIFFVISGFIVSDAASRAAGTAPRLRASLDFALRRIFRIFPLYWIALAVAIGLGGWIHIAPELWPKSSVLSMAFLTTLWITPLSSAWSLAFEAYFYAALVLVILIAGRHVHLGIFVWLILQALWIGFGPPDTGTVGANELVDEFALGWLVGRVQHLGNNKTAWLAAIGALILWTRGAWLTAHRGLLMPGPRLDTFGLASALLLYTLLRLEMSGWRAPKPLERLGDVSYSIYLWHMIVLGIMYTVFPVSSLTFTAAMTLLIVWSFISYALIERPGIRLGKMLSLSR